MMGVHIKIYNLPGSNEDYVSGPYTAMFPAGITYATISIRITSDNIFEGNENFTLSIDSSSLPSYVTITNPGEVIVTILEDDGKLVLKLKHGPCKLAIIM